MDTVITQTKLFIGGFIAALSGFLGGMDGIMYALVAFISIDYVTGVLAAAKKHKLSSEIGFWGLLKKFLILCIIGVANIIDTKIIGGQDIFRTAISLYYIGNEGVSIMENAAVLGLPLPKQLVNALVQLRDKNDTADDKEDENIK